jgi:hypothetical protein
MRWLGQRLGFRIPDDWYHVTTDDFKQNFGATPLLQHWQSSAIAAVQEAFPEHDWKEWLFDIAPRFFWHDCENRRRYMRWLGEQLGYRKPDDWTPRIGNCSANACRNCMQAGSRVGLRAGTWRHAVVGLPLRTRPALRRLNCSPLAKLSRSAPPMPER